MDCVDRWCNSVRRSFTPVRDVAGYEASLGEREAQCTKGSNVVGFEPATQFKQGQKDAIHSAREVPGPRL